MQPVSSASAPTSAALDALARKLLDLLGRASGLESTFLTRIEEVAHEQKILVSRNKGTLQIPENLAVDWSDTLCRRALADGLRATADVPAVYPDSVAARELGLMTYVMAPVVTDDGCVFGTVCGVSTAQVDVSPEVTEMFETLAAMIAMHLDREAAARELAVRADSLGELALRDSLTGLPNRVLFAERLAAACSGPRLGSTAVLFVDLDDFKSINDSGGHARGDRVLAEVASRLRGFTRASDTVARLSGDEFALLLEDIDVDTVTAVARRVLDAVAEPIDADGVVMPVTASVGIAIRDQFTVDGPTLLARADMAMYVAKRDGKSRSRLFDHRVHAAVAGRAALHADLRTAVDAQQFVLHYQPIVALDTDRVEGMEALLRWEHPTRGMLLPGEFIDLAEESGLIVPIGEWVLRTACAAAAAWNASHPQAPQYVSVNVSPRQFGPGLRGAIADALRDADLDPWQLVIEITEGVYIGDDADPLVSLRDLGVRLAIDDFGTGYSSLSYLRRFPVDIVKIDRAFVHPEHARPDDEAFVAAIIDLCNVLQLDVIAEGVETAEEAARLHRLGVRRAQGFHLGRPAPTSSAFRRRGAPPRVAECEAVPSAPLSRHLCLAFDGASAFVSAARAFLAEGLANGERLLYVADVNDDEQLLADLDVLGDPAQLVRDGTLAVHTLRSLYTPGDRLDRDRQVATYRRLTDEAVADGYSGLRVAADATALVTGATGRRDFVAYEIAVDEALRLQPFNALCAYDVAILGDASGDLLSVHRHQHPESVRPARFQLHRSAGGLRLTGVVAAADRATFGHALAAAIDSAPEGPLTLDISGLTAAHPSALVELLSAAGRLPALRLEGASAGLAAAINEDLALVTGRDRGDGT